MSDCKKALREQPSDLSCNRCGECCVQGGACIYRNWDQSCRVLEFEGRCELLESLPDGSTSCPIIAKVHPVTLHLWNIRGFCDWPQFRKELPVI
jgi:hypothetical protein